MKIFNPKIAMTEEDKLNLWFFRNAITRYGREAMKSVGFKEVQDMPTNVTITWSTSMDVIHGTMVAISRLLEGYEPPDFNNLVPDNRPSPAVEP